MKNLNDKKGFTLVELIVVIAIIAILSAVLIPALTGYIKKEKENQDKVLAEAYSTLVKANFDTDTITKSDDIFDLDIILSFLINRNYKLSTQSSLRFIYNYESNEINAVKTSDIETYVGPEQVLFPNTWQVNSMTVIKEYGYFVTFPRVEYKFNKATLYGYDITYNKKDNIKYVDGKTEAGAYDKNNKQLKSWDQLIADHNADLSSDGMTHQVTLPAGTTSFIFPNTVRSLENGLQSKEGLQAIFVPDEVTRMVQGFSNNKDLEYLRLPASSGITYGDGFNFTNTPKMEYIHFPNELNKLGNGAFNGSGIKNIILPDGITKLENKPFTGAKNLECLAFSRKFERTQGNDTFQGCENLRELFIGKSIKYIETWSFAHDSTVYTPKLEKIYFEGVVRRWQGEQEDNNLLKAFPKERFPSTRVYCYTARNPKDLAYESSQTEYRYWRYVGFQMTEWN